MSDEAEFPWLEMSRDGFLSVVRRLKPKRLLKRYSAELVEIGFDGKRATFNVNEVVLGIDARGTWTGSLFLPYGLLCTFLRVRPQNDPVRLIFDGRRLQVGTSRIPATWRATAELKRP